MSSLPQREGGSAPLEQVPSRFCPRRLKRGQVKRYMSKGPLFGYMIACPGCGFIELHQDKDAGYVELEEQLVASTKPVGCMNCKSTISIAGGVVVALPKVLP